MTATTDIFTVEFTATEAAEVYAASDRKGKAALRTGLREAKDLAIRSGNFDLASHLVTVIEPALVAPKSESATPDYPAMVADLRATLVAALDAVDSGNVTMPEGVEVPVGPVSTEGTVDPKALAKFTNVTGRKSGRGSVAEYVDSVLGDEAMTVAELRAAWVPSSDYPKQPPSAGAIGACLKRDNSDEFTATERDGVLAAERV